MNSGTKSENLDKFSLDRYQFQRIMKLGFKYQILDEKGNFLFSITRPPFRSSIFINEDEKGKARILSIKSRFLSREYEIQDKQGLTVGRIKKKGAVKVYWEIFDSQGIIKMAEAREIGRKGYRSTLMDYDIFIGQNKVGGFVWNEPESQKVEGAYLTQANLSLTDKTLDRRLVVVLVALMGCWDIVK